MNARYIAVSSLILAVAVCGPIAAHLQNIPENSADKTKAKAAAPKTGATKSAKPAPKTHPIPPPKPAGATLNTARETEAAARRCDTALEALRLYQLFIADARIPALERESARAGMEPWQKRVENKLVRVGPKWMPLEDRNQLQDDADALVKEAFDLISRITYADVAGGAAKVMQNIEAAVAKIDAAKKKFPDGIYHDFLLGFMSAAYAHDAPKAQKQFAECVKQDPDHVSALNNLAVTHVRLKKYPEALRLWKLALETAPGSPEIAQNIGRLLRQFELNRVKLNKSAVAQLEQLQADIATFGETHFDPKAGWIYMSYYESPLKVGAAMVSADAVPPGAWKQAAIEKAEGSTSTTTSSKTAKPRMMVGTGAGFVIFPNYVVTNRHLLLTADGASIVAAGATKRLPAEIVAVSETHDLALLKCEGLTAPAASLAKEFPKIGAAITMLGFPSIERLEAATQTTQGQILTLPDAATAQMALLNADVHRASTGGPVINPSGAVVALLSAPQHGELSHFTCGVPAAAVREFARGHIKDFSEPSSAEKPATDLVQKATVLVFVEKDARRPPIAGAAASGGALAGMLFNDPWCTDCDGRPSPKCTAPKCRNGRVTVVHEKLVSDGFRSKTVKVKSERPCPVCTGLGVRRCVRCLGKGLDPDVIGY